MSTTTMPSLEKFLEPLPKGWHICNACGSRLRNRSKNLRCPSVMSDRFRFNGCGQCGHLLVHLPDGTTRNLTRAEVLMVESAPDFAYIRECQQQATKEMVG